MSLALAPSSTAQTAGQAMQAGTGYSDHISLEMTLYPQANGSVGLFPGAALKGQVAVLFATQNPESGSGCLEERDEAFSSLELRYCGFELVGGVLDENEYFDSEKIKSARPRKGTRALNKIYFDESIELWRNQNQKQDRAGANGLLGIEPPKSTSNCSLGSNSKLPFSIEIPKANYPANIQCESESAPSQSFQICYQLAARLIGKSGKVIARTVQNIPFTPALQRSPHDGPQAPITRIIHDDRGKDCLNARITLSQPDYIPGDQVVCGLYLESTRTNRSVRKAECQLRQRTECRMRRIIHSSESVDVKSGSRPPSSHKYTDDSDILWTRVVDMDQAQQLTLTSVGVGLAAAAATLAPSALANGTGLSSFNPSSSVVASNESQISEVSHETSGGPEAPRKESSRTMGSGIMSGYRSCSANIHTTIPIKAPMVPGHFLSFSYELLITITIGSLGRGTQRVTTRIPLGNNQEPHTPTSSSCYFGATSGTAGAAPMSCRTLSHSSKSNASLHSLTKSNTNSTVDNGSGNGAGPAVSSTNILREQTTHGPQRFSVDAFYKRESSGNESGHQNTLMSIRSVPTRGATAMSIQTSMQEIGDALPNAVEQLRFRGDQLHILRPQLKPAAESEDTTSSIDASKQRTRQGTENGGDQDAPSATTKDGTISLYSASDDPGTGETGDEYDLARAVYDAAEKVLNDTTWNSPDILADVKTVGNHRAPDGTSSRNESSDANSLQEDLDQVDVEQAINQLAPTRSSKVAGESRTSLGSFRLKQFMLGIDFDNGNEPELSGILGSGPSSITSPRANSGKAVEKSPDQGNGYGSSDTVIGPVSVNTGNDDARESPMRGKINFNDNVVEGASIDDDSGISDEDQDKLRGMLRRSISMPDASLSTSAIKGARNTYSPGAATTRSAYASNAQARAHAQYNNQQQQQQLVQTSRLTAVSPKSVISVVSSVSRLGHAQRAGGVFKHISSKFSSWFNKK